MTVLFLIGITVGGLTALNSMPVESAPEIKIPIATVTTVFPGASPSDTEKLVTDELERSLKSIDDLNELTSTSSEGVSVIIVEFDAAADLTESIRNLRDEVETAKTDLPADGDEPVVKQIRADDEPIVTMMLVGTAPMKELKRYSDDVEEILEQINGVNRVEISGLPQEEMQVLLDIQALEAHELSVSDVARTIANHHLDFPVGTIRTNNLYYQASFKGQFVTAEELENLSIKSPNNQSVYLRDIATIRRAFGEHSSESTLYTAAIDEKETGITIEVFKKVGADLVTMVNEAKDEAAAFNETLPSDVRLTVTDDESTRIRRDIRNLINSAWQTIVVIAITLLLVLGTREALVTALSIPILYLISFIAMALMGSTFNFLSFFALILSLGIVVDTSVVVIEGVYENMNDHKLDSENAALGSIAMFKAPLISGSLTTIAAFLPLGLMTGIMGEYVKHIPITVNITLLASLFTALAILPAIAVRVLRRKNGGTTQKLPPLHGVFERLGEWYKRQIDRILLSRKRRRAWTIAMTILFFLSGALFATGIVKFKLFADPDIDFFLVEVNAPEGTALPITKEITQDVEEVIQGLPEIVRYVSVYGAGGSHKSSLKITLTDPKERSISSIDIAQQFRDSIGHITEADVFVQEIQSGPPTGADIEVRLLGEDMQILQEFSSEVEAELAQIEGTSDVRNDLELSPGEYHIRVKRDRTEYFGVAANSIASILRTSVYGDDSTKIKVAGEETPIVVSLDYRDRGCTQEGLRALEEAKDGVTLCPNDPKNISDILNVQIPTQRGQVPISELVDIKLVPAVTTIRHFNTDRSISVKSNVTEGVVPGDVLSELIERLETIEKPDGVSVAFGGENEDTAESMASLGRASILAILLIIAILVYQFGSFKQVLIILLTMPLAIMGVLYALAVIRVPLSFPGMIGIVALLGIVVNDAIVLIDRININRAGGMKVIDAVLTGCRQRLQPVLITTLTTALGVIPLIFNGDAFRDLAIVVAAGITVATVFTLVMVPIFYLQFEEVREGPGFLKRLGRRIIRVFLWIWKHIKHVFGRMWQEYKAYRQHTSQ